MYKSVCVCGHGRVCLWLAHGLVFFVTLYCVTLYFVILYLVTLLSREGSHDDDQRTGASLI